MLHYIHKHYSKWIKSVQQFSRKCPVGKSTRHSEHIFVRGWLRARDCLPTTFPRTTAPHCGNSAHFQASQSLQAGASCFGDKFLFCHSHTLALVEGWLLCCRGCTGPVDGVGTSYMSLLSESKGMSSRARLIC